MALSSWLGLLEPLQTNFPGPRPTLQSRRPDPLQRTQQEVKMNITRVQVHINRSQENPVKAWADIVIDDEFIVKGLQIRLDNEGYAFVTMPFRVKEINNDQVRLDIAHPIKESCRRFIQDKVLDAYEDVLNMKENKE
jgi:DNA-binding cell septation regulator SpoVG